MLPGHWRIVEYLVPNAYISGTGFHVPERVVTNHDLISEFGIDTTDEWIVQRTGIEARRFAPEGTGTADLAVPAALQALDGAGIGAGELDLIVFATLSPDHVFPGSGVLLQQKLGLPDEPDARFVPALDLRTQCSGFVYGLATAASMVRCGGARHVLLVGAEIHSAALDLSTRGRNVATLFGDGAGAVVVSATEEDRGVLGWRLGADGRHADVLCQKVWDISKRPFVEVDEQGRGVIAPEMLWAHMRGKLVFRHAVQRMAEVLDAACQDQGVVPADLDLVFFHQANLRINQLVARRVSLEDHQVVNNIQRYGNTTAATIPILLAESERTGRLQRGMKVAVVAFGSGFTWGAAILDW